MSGTSESIAYWRWLIDPVYSGLISPEARFDKLLWMLYEKAFRWDNDSDRNRAIDGMNLRRMYNHEIEIPGACSVLEMMIALAKRCEEEYMSNYEVGDRTAQWFWEMIVSLGLGQFTDDHFNRDAVNMILDRFLNKQYKSNGEGGLFTSENAEDMRQMPIWNQLMVHIMDILVDEGFMERR